MHYYEFRGINSFLIGMSKILLRESVLRPTRGFKCYELNAPVVFKITNPISRILTIPEREWNHFLPYVESLWLASGRNDMSMVGYYVKKLYKYSDDNETMRAGYGPRLRGFNGVADDYRRGYDLPAHDNPKGVVNIDQFQFVEKSFQNDPFTRQAIISLADPAKDSLDHEQNLKKTKDFPCTRDIHFTRNQNKLDVIVHMRSNDFVWGASGVNIFNFTFMQEYFAQILGLGVGNYYHMVNNFHYYESFKDKLEVFANITGVEDEGFEYKKTFTSLQEFDERLHVLETFERSLREDSLTHIPDFNDDFFNDWAKVLYSFHHTKVKVNFTNPLLNMVSLRKSKSRVINETEFNSRN